MKKTDVEKEISEQIQKYEDSVGLKVGWIDITRSKATGFNSNSENDITVEIKIKND